MPNTPAKSTSTNLTTSPSNAPAQRDEVEHLKVENARLRAELWAAREGRPAKPEQPTEPSFGISEGTRLELEENGTATSPFTGKQLGKDDLK